MILILKKYLLDDFSSEIIDNYLVLNMSVLGLGSNFFSTF